MGAAPGLALLVHGDKEIGNQTLSQFYCFEILSSQYILHCLASGRHGTGKAWIRTQVC